MPRTPEQNANIRDKRKAKIMKKALKLFAINGFDNVAVDDITEEANCSHGLFYHYFQTREDIYNELMKVKREHYAKYDAMLTEAFNTRGKKGLDILCDYLELMSSANEDVIYYSRLKVISGFATKTKESNLIGYDYIDGVVNLIKQAQEDGDVKEGDPKQIALILIDFANGISYRRLFAEESEFEVVPASLMKSFFAK